MSARGTHGNKYLINQIGRSNWELTGNYLGLSSKVTNDIIEEVIELVPSALEKTNNELPKDFDEGVAVPITSYVKSYLKRLKKINIQTK